jgi:VanZ family protein
LAESPAAPLTMPVFLRYWLPVFAYVAVIATLSAQANLKPPQAIQLSDKFYHAAEYCGLGLLLARAFRGGRKITTPLKSTLFVLGFGIMVAICDEIFQSFIPGRDSDVFDVLADATGLLIAQIVFLLALRD